MENIFTFNSLIAFLTLCALELVLGIDNIIFISILTGKLEKHEQNKARQLGLLLAVFTRILLLLSLSWVISLTAPMFTILNNEISGRDLILLLGGLFLIAKSTSEIHHKLENITPESSKEKKQNFINVILQILILDMVFSLDSVITAVGMVSDLPIMIAAVVISTLIMIISAKTISNFVEENPTIKILALSFLILIGVTLIAESLDQNISKGHIYFSMAFALFVEVINLKMRKKEKMLKLNNEI